MSITIQHAMTVHAVYINTIVLTHILNIQLHQRRNITNRLKWRPMYTTMCVCVKLSPGQLGLVRDDQNE